MGAISFFNKFNEKNRSTAAFSENLIAAQQALDLVFRNIALKKNQMLYPVSAHTMTHKEHQAAILTAVKKLTTNLRDLIKNSLQIKLSSDFMVAIKTLDEALEAYQADEHALPQLLLACSGIKIFLEKNL